MKLTDDEFLREQVFKRLSEMNWKDSELIKDAAERGVKIEASRWTKYKKNKSGQITDEILLWICTRIGINVVRRYGNPVWNGTKLIWVIPPYNEIDCLLKLKEMYGRNG